MIVPIVYLGGDLTTGLEFQLPDLPSSQTINSLVLHLARAPTTGPLIVRLKNAAGGGGQFIEAQVAAGALYGSPVSGAFTASQLWCEIVSGGGAGYLRGHATTGTQGGSDLVSVQVPGLLQTATQFPLVLAPGAPTIDRFVPMLLNASPSAPITLRLKRSQATITPSEYLESIIPAGQKQGPPSTGSFTPPADGTLWVDVIGGDGSAGWLYGTARVAPTGLLSDLYSIPVLWPGLIAAGESFLVRSPPFQTTLRYFRGGFESSSATPVSLSVEVEGMPGTTLNLALATHQSYQVQTGIQLAVGASTLLRVRVVSASVSGSWLTGALYFEAPLTGAIGLVGRIRAWPALAHDDIRIAAAQWAGR